MYRVWMNIRAAFSGHNRHFILKKIDYNEDAGKKAYAEALDSTTSMTDDIRYIIIEQKLKLKKAGKQ